MPELTDFLKRASKIANEEIKRLRLESWEIILEEDGENEKPACVDIEAPAKRAWLKLNPGHPEFSLHSIREHIRHELLHIVLAHMSSYLVEVFQAICIAKNQFEAMMAGFYYVEELTVEHLNRIFERKKE